MQNDIIFVTISKNFKASKFNKTLGNKVTTMTMFLLVCNERQVFLLLLRKASSASLLFCPAVFAIVLYPIWLVKISFTK